MRRVLAVLPYVPLPSDTGGTLRTLELMRALASRFSLDVLALNRPGNDAEGFARWLAGLGVPTRHLHLVDTPRVAPRETLHSTRAFFHGTPLTYIRFTRQGARESFRRAVEERGPFDIIHFDHLHMAQLLRLARELNPSAHLVIDEHNVESQLLARLVPLSAPPLRPLLRWQYRRLERLERECVNEADSVLACSNVDAALLRSLGARQVHVVPNGVKLPEFEHREVTGDDLVFVGSMDWWPNEDAVLRLAREVWPLVSSELAPGKLMVVGRSPPASVRALENERLVVTGSVPSVAPHLARALATAIPLRAGSGTRLKVLEAAAAGVPVVATRLAVEGLPMVEGQHVLLAESAQEFAAALRRLRNEPDLCLKLSRNARRMAEAFAWEGIAEGLGELYQNAPAVAVGGKKPPGEEVS
ncbi:MULTISPECIES: glycosyltransferase family 4 protein [Corallococcus]|uniref:glycosyltransferase family 4 protein n=1 Tax=Corallococcus TaxID=83461 RepID=UPI001378FCF6|nr:MULTISPECIES: glycosyltransferase family 4 protein [Corallococcus]NBD08894.1 glycosyltransferase [Corallococcus silvisoli]